jgi:DNA polymerase III delta prime subunit
MSNYNYNVLNDKEFELFATDLYSAVHQVNVEYFKAGRDKGIDGRYFNFDGTENIIQCKHWIKTPYKQLISILKKEDVQKVAKLKPYKFVFITSIELSHQNKEEIKKIFSPYIRIASDIWGLEDIERYASKNVKIIEKYYKLWIASTVVLKIILNNAIEGRSKFKLSSINSFVNKYVETSNHKTAYDILERSKILIITGQPGVGKTTLADQLSLFYISKGFKFYFLENSIKEAEDVFDESDSAKQIFYYDDFLGRNYLQALSRHEDSQIVNFIKRVKYSHNKRFILTSRTVILNRGKQLTDLFRIENVFKDEYEIHIKDFTQIEKAQVLYNHIWFSTLDDLFIDEIYENKRYKIIIGHKNYSPRLISFITDQSKFQSLKSNQYWEYILSTLNNPIDIWQHVFTQQLDKPSVLLVLLVYFNGKKLSEYDLRESFHQYYSIFRKEELLIDFDAAVKLVTGSCLNRVYDNYHATTEFDLFNPSIGDYILQKYKGSPTEIYKIFLSLNTVSSLKSIKSLSNAISKDEINKIVNKLLNDVFNKNGVEKSLRYKSHLLYFGLTHFYEINLNGLSELLLNNFTELLNSDNRIETIAFLYHGIVNKILKSNDQRILKYIKKMIDYGDSALFASFTELLNITTFKVKDELLRQLKENIIAYWKDTIDEHIKDDGVLDGYFGTDYDGGDPDNEVTNYINDIFCEYELSFSEDELDSIFHSCSMDDHFERNREKASYEEYQYDHWEDNRHFTSHSNDPIDDLFER